MLADAQKLKILRLLGYPFGSIDPSSLDYSNLLSKRLDEVGNDAVTEVEALLDQLDAIDSQLSAKISQAGIKRIDDIEFFEGSHKVLKSEKHRVISDLSSLLGIPNRSRGGFVGAILV
jgi:hypothetical protein